MVKKDVKKIGTFNCQGLVTSKVKLSMLADDFEKKHIDILAIQETHLKEHGIMDISSNSGKQYKFYYSGHKTKSVNGVGIIVNSQRKIEFEPISDRICQLTTKINDNQKLNFICAYAPTLKQSEVNPEIRENFYAQLDSVIKKSKSRDALVIGGDFNAKTGSAFIDKIYHENIGKYGKGMVNSSGLHLLNFAKSHGIQLTNTFFKHKAAHISTWEAPDHMGKCTDSNSNTPRKSLYRNQIDYICTKKQYHGIKILDSRSYGGMSTRSDHKLVLMTCIFKWPYTKYQKSSPKLNFDRLHDRNTQDAYRKEVERLFELQASPSNNQERWSNIASATTTAAKNILGYRDKHSQHENPEIAQLSEKQKNIKQQIDNSSEPAQREHLRKERNKVMNSIHKAVIKHEKQEVEKQIENIEKHKDDSTRMFQAIKDINRQKPRVPLLIKTKSGTLTANEKEQCEIIASYFKQQFLKDTEHLPDLEPRAMRRRFTRTEIRKAVRKLKNNKSAGLDQVVAELLKYGPDILYDEIAIIFNTLAETGDCPVELIQGIICALQKPGKTKGPLDHLRPIILLSMLRKILAICLKDRTIERIDRRIPPSQAAYRSGRSTTEHVFAAKVLCEKAITSADFTIYLLLLDMSKAFDTVNRQLLLEDLSNTLEKDEVHLIKILLGIELSVRCGNETSDFFETDTGVPQGDGYSANEFTFYLANTLNTFEQQADHDHAKSPAHLPFQITAEHSYHKPVNNEVDIDMEYADDLTAISTNKKNIDHKKQDVPRKLEKRNLKINNTKTEEYEVTRNGDDCWKDCKLLGSLLGTDNDIKRRKGLAVAVINNKRDIFYSKLDIHTKVRVFNCYVGSVFLYNSELWGLTATKLKAIDSFHRRILRTSCLNVRWPRKVTNQQVYTMTGTRPWSVVIQERQMSWFGHLSRLPSDTPARRALEIALQPMKRPRGKPKTTWLSMMTDQFRSMNLTWREAEDLAKNRFEWANVTK